MADILSEDKPGPKGEKEKPPAGSKASPASWARKNRVIAWRAAVRAAGHKVSEKISEAQFLKAVKGYNEIAVAKRMTPVPFKDRAPASRLRIEGGDE